MARTRTRARTTSLSLPPLAPHLLLCRAFLRSEALVVGLHRSPLAGIVAVPAAKVWRPPCLPFAERCATRLLAFFETSTHSLLLLVPCDCSCFLHPLFLGSPAPAAAAAADHPIHLFQKGIINQPTPLPSPPPPAPPPARSRA